MKHPTPTQKALPFGGVFYWQDGNPQQKLALIGGVISIMRCKQVTAIIDKFTLTYEANGVYRVSTDKGASNFMAWRIIHRSYKSCQQFEAEKPLRNKVTEILGALRSSRNAAPDEAHFVELHCTGGGLARPVTSPRARLTVQRFVTNILADNGIEKHSGKVLVPMLGQAFLSGELIVEVGMPLPDEFGNIDFYETANEARGRATETIAGALVDYSAYLDKDAL